MDKKNLTLGIAFLIAALATPFILGKFNPPPPAAPVPAATATESAGTAPGSTTTAGTAPSAPSGAELSAPAPVQTPAFAALAENRSDAQVLTLANDFVSVRFTNFGGAIQDVAFKKYPAHQGSDEPFVFNQRHAAPLLAIGEVAGLGQSVPFALVSSTDREVVYRAVLENRLEVTRRYALADPADDKADPYRIRHETTVRNLTDATQALPRLVLELGTSALVSENDRGLYLNVAAYDGDDAEVTDRAAFDPSFFSRFGMGSSVPQSVIEHARPVVWAAVKNQFFASIYTPDQPGQSIAVRRVDLPALSGAHHSDTGITGAARFDQPSVAPGATTTHGGQLYVGPKEYSRLAKFEKREDKVMQFDRYFFNRIALSGIVAPILNRLMVWMHDLVGNWGIAIILMTLLLKFISVPFTLAASKSAKRMAKISGPMKEIREKYKDNPKKLNEATLALFKEHKVNPAGGCIPILITIPLFIGFYAMLMGTAELRFQPFLWAHDLSAPDTVARVFGLPLNIMPLLMGATMIVQMRLTPQPTNIEGPQATVMKIMPWLFTLFCYNFAAALALYSTINGLFTIGQQLLVNKFSKDEPVGISPASIAAREARALKNVTPKKK